MIEAWTNYDTFRDRPIVPMHIAKREPRAQYDERTSAAARGLGRALNVSPMQTDHLVRGYFGTLGALGLSASTWAADLASDNPHPAMRMHDWPVIGWAIRDGEAATRYVGEFYRLRDELQAWDLTTKALLREGRQADAVRRVQRHPLALETAKSARKIGRALSKIGRAIDAVRWDQSLSGEEKRRRIDELMRLRNDVAFGAVDALDAVNALNN